MATPSNRVPVRIARGTKASLVAGLSDLVEGEICYATDENTIYAIENGLLTPTGGLLELNVVDDNSPQLGGDLDVNGFDFISVTGAVDIGSANGELVVRGGTGEGKLTLNCTANSHGVSIQSPPHSAGATYTLTLPNDTGTSGQALTTDGSGVLTWATPTGGGGGATTIDELSDVDTSTVAPLEGQALVWDGTAGEWKPGTVSTDGGGGAVDSVNGQTGVVSLSTKDLADVGVTDNIPSWAYTPGVPANESYSYAIVGSVIQLSEEDDSASFPSPSQYPVPNTSIFVKSSGGTYVEQPITTVQLVEGTPRYFSIDTPNSAAEFTAASGGFLEVKFRSTTLQEGDVLKWNSTNQKFEGKSVVDSINGKTGVATLGFEDLTDFAQAPQPPTFDYSYVANPEIGPYADGEVQWNTFYGSSNLSVYNIDSNGQSWPTYDASTNNYQIWVSIENGAWVGPYDVYYYDDYYGDILTIEFETALPAAPADQASVRFTIEDPSQYVAPTLNEGSVLRYDATRSEFWPVQGFTVVGVAATELDSLSKTPQPGDSGSIGDVFVDSYNQVLNIYTGPYDSGADTGGWGQIALTRVGA